MFERFTDRARRVLVLSQEATRKAGTRDIGSDAILWGLVTEGSGIAAKALDGLVDAETILAEMDKLYVNKQITGHIPYTDAAKKILELSLREALQLGHNYIGTEHILLGWCRYYKDRDVPYGLDVAVVRKAVTDLLIKSDPTTKPLTKYQDIAISLRSQKIERLQRIIADPPTPTQLVVHALGGSIDNSLYLCLTCGIALTDDCPDDDAHIPLEVSKA